MGSLKVGDKAIVVRSNYDHVCKWEVGVVIEVDPTGLIKDGPIFVFPYKLKLSDGSQLWCRAVPYSPLMVELL